MTLTEQIDNIYEQMKIQPLSQILQLLLPISLECQDYEGYCILYYWNLTIVPNSKLDLKRDLIKILLNEGLEETNIDCISEEALETIIKMRTVGKNQVDFKSVVELENALTSLEKLMNNFYYSNDIDAIDSIIKNKQMLEKQLSTLKSFITNKLTGYQRKATKLEKDLIMKNNIKEKNNVFIIHGHNETALLQLEKMLKEKFNLNPIILKDKPNNGLTIIEKFEQYAQTCSYAVALFTPDDIIENENGDKYFQSRPNVIFELGWFFSHLGRSRTIILEQVSPKSDIFSDLQGIMRIQFNKDVSESYLQIQKELQSIGII